jgi:hypothetical protein
MLLEPMLVSLPTSLHDPKLSRTPLRTMSKIRVDPQRICMSNFNTHVLAATTTSFGTHVNNASKSFSVKLTVTHRLGSWMKPIYVLRAFELDQLSSVNASAQTNHMLEVS